MFSQKQNKLSSKKVESSDDEEELKELQHLNRNENRKQRKSGGFQSMGLSNPVFKGVMFKGYKVPTPIQRKTIPMIMDKKDVVAMARTGSGKTGAFVIPMLERLKTHNPTGARAVILSPTRELALQTYKFAKELGKFTKLKFTLILGGDKIEDQFAALHENPDVIIATPGRFMHVLSEMNLKLLKVEYVVFDEADRLFEMGFQEQLGEILQRLPENRQTLLFSATLPKMLVEFASAGLNSPELIRLDVDTKLPDLLKLFFFECRSDDKVCVLLYLLHHIIKSSEPTVIFAATKHHVEYLNMVLTKAGYKCSISYSSLDPIARNINVDRFRNRRTNIFIVTDLAARGIDIPLLVNVINFNFPAKPKLFLHRVGRVARAGNSGNAYSIVCADEKAYVLDLHMFLGRTINFVKESDAVNNNVADNLYGLVPQSAIDEEDRLKTWNETVDFKNMLKVTSNAYKHYLKTRNPSSSESIKRMKAMSNEKLGYHPLFARLFSHLKFFH
ncbi:hypothetical protein HELRODRAFT_109323 [Helobdella robusta]|uniref:RNA helicase n=1 Tax=Helobdella robusta TaxID=6412 RepID=T1EES4_HELRO|nr:hypothetical protein HELRODRAFT_109323 [Helobdella robusta]ESO09856.1 hypothetical protein HELRODRAFT_109323 [Helobdella robusta]